MADPNHVTPLTHVQEEETLLTYWDQHNIFVRSIEQRRQATPYVFFDGPPFATGLPHYGHLLASIIKDVVPRFWTMNGRCVERRWGWDCHGVPIENMIEKELDLKGGKRGIEEMGIGAFNNACRAAILRFDKEWEGTIRRIGRWVDFKNSYKTMDASFMESVWWGFSELWKKGLVYEGRRVILYCPRCATPLSNFEIAMDNSYKDLEDHSIIVKFPLVGEDRTFFLAWTTTPWTLPGNVAVAVQPEAIYVCVERNQEKYWVAKDRLKDLFLDASVTVVREVRGVELVGKTYTPLYTFMTTEGKSAYRVVAADFVSLEDGTGIVHTAALFGEDDYRLAQTEDLPCVPTLDDQGRFLANVEPIAGLFYKKAEDWVIQNLVERNLLFRQEKIVHSYPVCYRCATPLYYNAVPAWFINVQAMKPDLIKANEAISWYPDHLKAGRFGKGPETAPDWNISRSRYWGNPMPVWVGERTGKKRIFGSYAELAKWAVNPEEVEKLTDYHREYLDQLEVWVDDERTEKGRRIPDIFDCWVESGSMPFAEVHYLGDDPGFVERRLPAQFVTEYIAQTRAWFYVMHVMSVGIFGSHAVEHILTTGTVLAEDGTKMSKSKKNYPDPSLVLNQYGADAVRLYLMSNPIVNGENLNFSESGVSEVQKKFVTILRNVVSFYELYRTHDDGRTPTYAHPLDAWIRALMAQTRNEVTASLEAYDLATAARSLQQATTELSTWYVRRSRDRVKEPGEDQKEALATLRTVLELLAKLSAPFTPFLADWIYLRVQTVPSHDSVHLCDWPADLSTEDDATRQHQMQRVRSAISRLLEERSATKIPVRQILSRAVVARSLHLDPSLFFLIKEEINVKNVEVEEGEDVWLDTVVTPELEREGAVRDLTRRVNDARKRANLTIHDRILLVVRSEQSAAVPTLSAHHSLIERTTLSTLEVVEELPVDAGWHTEEGKEASLFTFAFKQVE